MSAELRYRLLVALGVILLLLATILAVGLAQEEATSLTPGLLFTLL